MGGFFYVNGSPQYKLNNSKGKTYCVRANEAEVKRKRAFLWRVRNALFDIIKTCISYLVCNSIICNIWK
ncbi:hypothetical protein FC701_07900 [Bacillus mycoides]|uniref:Uncharacterized protein n=1 Tax=Bacillus mycoides TaxID=1405 RepID=A0A4U3ADD4_BACMY|nr:hypothetical protein FC701_07900 [Bacillus mycoides]